MKIRPLIPSNAGPMMMGRRDLSMGLPENIARQAARTVAQLAQMEAMRQVYVTKGYAAAASKTLQGMGALFAAGPTTEEMQGYLKNRMVNGGIVSGKDYYDRIQRGLSTSYSSTSNSPENLKAYAQRAADRSAGAVPASLRPYIRPSIQAASYVYATKQAEQTGSALAGLQDSVVERARMAENARTRATYLMGLAGLAGEEAVDVPSDILPVLVSGKAVEQSKDLVDDEQWALKQYASASDDKKAKYRACIKDESDDIFVNFSNCREILEPIACPAGNYAKNSQVTEASGGFFSGKKFYGWTGAESCVYSSDPRVPGGDTGGGSGGSGPSLSDLCGDKDFADCVADGAVSLEKLNAVHCRLLGKPLTIVGETLICPVPSTGGGGGGDDDKGDSGMDTTTVVAIVGGVAVLGLIAVLAFRKRS